MSLKLLFDENIPPRVAMRLRQLGFGTIHVREVNLKGCEGTNNGFRAHGRALPVTLDAYFADIRRYPPGSHKGIVRLKLKFAPASVVVSALLSLLPKLVDAPVKEGVLVISDGKRYRLRLSEETG